MTTKDQHPDHDPVTEGLNAIDVPANVDRRTFLTRRAVLGAATAITGCSRADSEKASAAAVVASPPSLPTQPAVALSPDLDVVKRSGREP